MSTSPDSCLGETKTVLVAFEKGATFRQNVTQCHRLADMAACQSQTCLVAVHVPLFLGTLGLNSVNKAVPSILAAVILLIVLVIANRYYHI